MLQVSEAILTSNDDGKRKVERGYWELCKNENMPGFKEMKNFDISKNIQRLSP